METPLAWWVGFGVFIFGMLALDLGVFHRKAHEVRFREAMIWTCVWVSLGLLFNLGILAGWFGSYPLAERALRAKEFFAGFIVEYSLSVDNVFVFAVIFTYFAVPGRNQHGVLFYGILGAIVLRFVFIISGLWLIEKFAWMFYVFGGFLIITGIKMAVVKEKRVKPERNPAVRLARAVLPVTDRYVGNHFLIRLDGKLHATPLLLVLGLIETTDVVFAADSIPAVIAITRDSFIVFTSNIFAILGLRAWYFALANFMKMFRYLSYGLAVLLVFIGCKMLAHAAFGFKLPTAFSLLCVASILLTSILASILNRPKDAKPPED
jgi:tellurite resistance protein TerC